MGAAVYIYALCDPETLEPRYVGKAKNPKKRYGQHVCPRELARYRTHRSAWIKSLLAKGLQPFLRILEEVDESQWADAERRHIRRLNDEGARLVNGDRGGMGGHHASDHSRRVSGLRCKTPGHRAAVSRGLKGRPQGEIHRINRQIALNYAWLRRKGFPGMAEEVATSMRQWATDHPHVFPASWKKLGLTSGSA